MDGDGDSMGVQKVLSHTPAHILCAPPASVPQLPQALEDFSNQLGEAVGSWGHKEPGYGFRLCQGAWINVGPGSCVRDRIS